MSGVVNPNATGDFRGGGVILYPAQICDFAHIYLFKFLFLSSNYQSLLVLEQKFETPVVLGLSENVEFKILVPYTIYKHI